MIEQPTRLHRLHNVFPVAKRTAFNLWLTEVGATRPLLPGVAKEEQDGFFEADLEAFMTGGKPFKIGDE